VEEGWDMGVDHCLWGERRAWDNLTRATGYVQSV